MVSVVAGVAGSVPMVAANIAITVSTGFGIQASSIVQGAMWAAVGWEVAAEPVEFVGEPDDATNEKLLELGGTMAALLMDPTTDPTMAQTTDQTTDPTMEDPR